MPGLSRRDVAIVGGGPAGAAAAIALARAGRDVVLFERSRGAPHKVCGSFLSAEVVRALASLGLDPAELGAAPIARARITAGSNFSEAGLPFPAAGLSREMLDPTFLAAARAAGAEVRTGFTIREIQEDDDRVCLKAADGTTWCADHVLVATGKTDLPGQRRETSWRGRADMLGLKMPLALDRDAARRLGATIELHLFRGGCAGLQPIEDGANLCITLTRPTYDVAGRDFYRLLDQVASENAAFDSALIGARCRMDRPLAIARVPYGFRRRPGEIGGPRQFWLGDQMAVTASFTGDGLALAMESGLEAATALIRGGTRAAYEATFHRRAARQIRPAMLLQSLVDRPSLHSAAVAMAAWQPGLIALLARLTRLKPSNGSPVRNPG